MAVITVYPGAFPPVPADSVDLSWEELADELTAMANEPSGAPADAPAKEQKRRMLAWSPHALTAPHRLEKNVAAVTAMVIDVDNDPPEALREAYVIATPDEVAARLEAAGVAGLVYESPSSTAACPRFRVVAPLVEPIAPARTRETRLAFAEALGLTPGCGVEGAVDAAKLFFAGRLHGTPERRVWRVAGTPLHETELPVTRLAWGAAQSSGAASMPIAELPPADAGLAAALGPWDAHAGRKWFICGALGGVMRKMGYSAAQCEAVVRAWLPADDASVDVAAGVRRALNAWTMPAERVTGHGSLAEHLGESHAGIVERAAWAGSFAGRVAAARPTPTTPMYNATPWATPVVGGGDALGESMSWLEADTPIDYLCAELRLCAMRGKVTLIAGDPGAGKGPLAGHLALCLATGTPALSRWACRASNVIVLDVEGAMLSKRRIARMARAAGIDPRDLHGRLDLRDMTRTADWTSDRFYYALEASGADVIVLDSYTTAMMNTGADPNKIEFGGLAKLLGALGKLVICVAHANKSPPPGTRPHLKDIAGSYALAALAGTAIAIWRPDENVLAKVNVGCARAPETGFATFELEFADVAHDGLALRVLTAEDARRAESRATVDARVAVANAVLTWFCRHSPIHAQSQQAMLDANVATDNSATRPVLKAALAGLVDAGFLALDATRRPLVYRVTNPQATTTVTLDGAGRFVTGASAFVRP